ncbi:MAG: arabinan endo-1,5-alpha-L-arabinosidase [Opitutaceae bacterium]|nr:arabinan endo-1,5-alpha-L-arabinosidase [Opitutaceae bacterium]
MPLLSRSTSPARTSPPGARARGHRRLILGLAVAGLFGLSAASARQVSIHDPVMTKQGGTFYLFSTDPGIKIYASTDMVHWRLSDRVFPTEPTWAKSVAPTFNGHIWAPDILQYDGKFYLYYSVSAFGKNTSAIGLTINKTLDPTSPDYAWEDQGIVLRSVPNRDLWNAIDSHVVVDDTGTPWMSFGSFWGGLKLVRLTPDARALAEPQEWYSIAKRERSVLLDDRQPGPAEIEAPFIFRKGEYYYLFVSWDKCCRGRDSTYKMMLGRSKDVRGPYVDKTGKDLAAGGGTILLAGTPVWPGVGHNGAYTFDGRDYVVFHAYEAADNGLQKLKIAELHWDTEGWPFVDPTVLDSYVSVLED